MSVKNKRILSSITFYTLAGLTLIMSAFFILCLSIKDVVLWARIIYYVWTAVVIGVTVFDIICTNSGEGKFVSGLIVYVLSILAFAMTALLYFLNSGMNGIAVDFFNLFISISIISIIVTCLLIATFVVGESRVEQSTTEIELGR